MRKMVPGAENGGRGKTVVDKAEMPGRREMDRGRGVLGRDPAMTDVPPSPANTGHRGKRLRLRQGLRHGEGQGLRLRLKLKPWKSRRDMPATDHSTAGWGDECIKPRAG
jgi:hypothetical protein